jgi:hypothetical protein
MIRTFIGLAAVGIVIAGAPQAVARSSRHPSTRVIPFHTSGTPLTRCTAGQPPAGVAKILRVRLLDPIDAVFDPTVGREVRVQRTSADGDDDDNQFDNNSDDNTWTGADPYDVNLTSLSVAGGAWVEVKLLLKERSDDNAHITEVSAQDNSVDLNSACFTTLAYNNGNGRSVATLFFKHGGAVPKVAYWLNIVITAPKGATSTKVIIDPKVMNNG